MQYTNKKPPVWGGLKLACFFKFEITVDQTFEAKLFDCFISQIKVCFCVPAS